jgi:hypothetical protein
VSVYKLYSASIGDGVASVDVVKTGKIVGIQWAASGDLDADGETFAAELSFSSSSGLTSNDTKSSISAIRQQNGLLTSGAIATGINQMFPMPDVQISEGERLYLHTSGTSIVCTAYVWVEDGLDIAGRQRRLRL